MAAESFDVELRLLTGGFVGPAKQAADVLDALEDKLDRTSSAFEDAFTGKVKHPVEDAKKSIKGFGDEIQRVTAEAAKLTIDPKGFQLLAKAKKELADQRKKLLDDAGLGKPPKPPGGGSGGGDNKGFAKGFANEFGFGALASAEAFGSLIASSITGAASALVSAAEKVVSVFAEGFKRAFQEGSRHETLKVGYRLSLRGREGQESLEDVNRFAKLTGFRDDDIARMLLPARRAGFSQQGARTAFAAATDIAAGMGRGGDEGYVQSLLEGFTHIKLKGGVQERRLPEMGVDVKKFYASLASTLKVTADSAKKLAEEGKIDPQLLLNTIYKGVEERQGGRLGTGGIAYGKTMEARLSKLGELPERYLKAVAESPRWDAVSEKFGSLLIALDPESPRGQKIVNSILNAFGTLADVIDKVFTPENIDHFVQGLTAIVSLAGEFASYLGPILQKASDVVSAYNHVAEIRDNGGEDPYLKNLPTYEQREQAGAGFHFSDLFPAKGQSISDWLDRGNSDAIARAQNASYSMNLAAKSATGGGAPVVHLLVNVTGAIDQNNAKQVGQQVGQAAGQETARHLGRVAQEAGAR